MKLSTRAVVLSSLFLWSQATGCGCSEEDVVRQIEPGNAPGVTISASTKTLMLRWNDNLPAAEVGQVVLPEFDGWSIDRNPGEGLPERTDGLNDTLGVQAATPYGNLRRYRRETNASVPVQTWMECEAFYVVTSRRRTEFSSGAAETTEHMSTSAPTSPVSSLGNAVGFFKPALLKTATSFGGAVALSGDGSVLAVGAPADNSAATGFQSTQAADEGAPGLGAVHLFTRTARSDIGETWTSQGWLKPDDTITGGFGTVLALSDDGRTLVVGAPAAFGMNGAVLVYERSDSGIEWTRTSHLIAPDNPMQTLFGAALALSADGTVLAVGATADGDGAGAVHVFRKGSDGWTATARLAPSELAAGMRFGAALALRADGTLLAVGSPYEAGGRVRLYKSESNTWTLEGVPFLSAVNADADRFGSSVALSASGDTLVAGAPGAHQFAGEVLIFERNGGSWFSPTRIEESATGPGAEDFGASVAISSDGRTVLASAPTYPATGRLCVPQSGSEGRMDAGAAFSYRRPAQAWDRTWTRNAYLVAPNSAAGATFGRSLALSRDAGTLAIGAPQEATAAAGVFANTEGATTSPSTESAPGPTGAVYLF